MNVLTRAMTFLVALVSAICLLTPHAQAVSYSWNAGAGGDWTTEPTKWTPNGDPNGVADDVSFGDIAGAYVTTLNSVRTVGGLSLTGADPTLTVNSFLTISGGASTIGGSALLNGTGVMEWTNSAALTWSSSAAPGGTLEFRVPNQASVNSVTMNNSGGGFAVGTGQSLTMMGIATTPQQTLTFSDGFSNSGLIQMGNQAPGDNYGHYKIVVSSGTLTNNAGGQINLYPRSATNNSFSDRYIEGNVTNDGTITSLTTDGRLGNTGDTITNNSVINLDSSFITGGGGTGIPKMTIWGSTLNNNGTVNINDGRFVVGTDTLTYVPADYNSTGGILGLGRTSATIADKTVVTWNAADTTDAMTYEITPGSRVEINRATAWTLPSNQSISYPVAAQVQAQRLTLNQDFNNDGSIVMGKMPPGDNYASQFFDIPAGTFTNNSGGTVTMYPRSATNLSLGTRAIRSNVVNDGLMTSLTTDGQLGTTGKTVVNNGTITLDSSIFTTGGRAKMSMIGTSFTNNSGGVININDGHFRVATDTYTYGPGTYNINGGIFGFGLTSTTLSKKTVVTWNGSDFTNPMTFEITAGSRVEINRASPWTLQSNQALTFPVAAQTQAHRLTLNQDFNNNGSIVMGKMPPGDNYATQFLTLSSGTFTNGASGTVTMYPRSATNLSFGTRAIEANVVNDGQITSLTIDGRLGTTGKTVLNNGTLTLDSSIFTTGGKAKMSIIGDSFINSVTGRIEGNGNLTVTGVTGGLMNDGTLAPGLSAGTLDILGNVTNSATSALEIELGGLIAGTEHDQLNISQTFAIDGELLVTLINGFETTVTNSDVFTITTFGNSTGTFSNLIDGRVTIQDLLIDGLPYNFLVTINANNIVLSEFEANPVPEPSSLALLGLGMFGLIGRARRKQRRG